MQGPSKPAAGERKKTYGIFSPLLNFDEQHEEHSELGLSPRGARAISSGSPCGLRLPDGVGGSRPGDRLSTGSVSAPLPALPPPSIRRPAGPDANSRSRVRVRRVEISTPALRLPT